MTTSQEALAAMAKAEQAWNKMVDETVEVSGQFIKECEAFQKECQAGFPDAPEQDERLLP
jgi:vacuolar-type H+-ATPase subunit H|tara:strand:- start:479 stop:658 length:180 start_codon:yes stop_codon:yes gene_type:complete